MWTWYFWTSVYLAAFCIMNPELNSVLNPGVNPSVSASREGFGGPLQPLENRGDNLEGTITLPGPVCDRMKHLTVFDACFQCSSLFCGRNTNHLRYRDSLLQTLCVYCLQTSVEQSPWHSVARLDDRSSSDGYQWHAPVVISEEKRAGPWKRAQKHQSKHVMRKRSINTVYEKRSNLIQSARENFVFDVTIPKRMRRNTNGRRHAFLMNVPYNYAHGLSAKLRKLGTMRSRHDQYSLMQKSLASLENIQKELRSMKKYKSDSHDDDQHLVGQTDGARVISDVERSNERYKELLFLSLLAKLKKIDQAMSTSFPLKYVHPFENNMLASKRQYRKLPGDVIESVRGLGLTFDEFEHPGSSRSELLSDDLHKQSSHRQQDIQPPTSTATENPASILSTLLPPRMKQLRDVPYRKLYRTRPVTDENELWTLGSASMGADFHYDGDEQGENVEEERKERMNGHGVENTTNDDDDDVEEEEDDDNDADNHNGDDLWEYQFDMLQNESTLEKSREQLGEGSQARSEVFQVVRPRAVKRWGTLGIGKFRTWWLGKRNAPINP